MCKTQLYGLLSINYGLCGQVRKPELRNTILHWTNEQILALAPDPNTLKRGQGLANAKKWLSLETDGRAIWGRCKSSGSAHYETTIDLKGPAFKCNCPSRKFPCKHSIGLLLYSQSNPDNVEIAKELPEDVAEWINKRDAKSSSEKKEKSPEESKKAEDRKAKAFDARMQLMESGMDDLYNWLTDIIRTGMATVDGGASEMVSSKQVYQKDSSVELWRSISMRMVDSKLPGIGRKIRELALIRGVGSDWPLRMLEELSDLFLILKGFNKLKEIPEALQKDLLGILGVNTPKETLLNQKGIEDNWMVIGQFEGTNIDNALVRRTWFLGEETERYALILEYDYINQGFPFHWPKGRIFRGEMLYYPSMTPMRAIMRNQAITEHIVDAWKGYESIQKFSEDYARELGKNPWLSDFPVALSHLSPIIENESLILVDRKGKGLPVLNKELSNWKIMALSGGVPIDVFGEWTGKKLNPLAVLAENRFISL